jgi:hypothetical protein
MMTSREEHNPHSEDQIPFATTGPYNPVTVTTQDTWGAIILGIISVILLIGWLLSEKRNRELMSWITQKRTCV